MSRSRFTRPPPLPDKDALPPTISSASTGVEKTSKRIRIRHLRKDKDRIEVSEYTSLNNDQYNYGVFSLPEGAMFRHHAKEWIKELLKDLEIVSEKIIIVKTMNGHAAEAFQILARK